MEGAALAALVTAASAVLGAALVPLTRRLARRYGVIDEPGGRKLHTVATPRLGGVAVFVSFLAVVLGGYFLLGPLRGLPWVRTAMGDAMVLFRDASKVE